jgi:hypothetical protein
MAAKSIFLILKAPPKISNNQVRKSPQEAEIAGFTQCTCAAARNTVFLDCSKSIRFPDPNHLKTNDLGSGRCRNGLLGMPALAPSI